jgi:thioredoxin 2
MKPVVVMCVFCAKPNRVDLSRLAESPKCGNCGRPIRLDRPLPVTDGVFEKVIKGASAPVLVDFYADWCGPCKMMAPFVDQIAAKYLGKVLVAKLDTDRAQQTARQFRITGVPTVAVFRDGKAVVQQAGAGPLQHLENLLRQAGVA